VVYQFFVFGRAGEDGVRVKSLGNIEHV
jgi:hypothetical protein